MALITCKKCKKEISTTAKFCPQCGESNIKVYCRECGKEMEVTDTSCAHCGYIVNQVVQYNNSNYDASKGDKYEIAIASLICAFFAPLVGLILGLIALNSNKGKQNQAKTIGMIATIVSGIEMALVAIIMVLYIVLIIIGFTTL